MKDPHKRTIFQLATNNLSLYNVEKAIENSRWMLVKKGKQLQDEWNCRQDT